MRYFLAILLFLAIKITDAIQKTDANTLVLLDNLAIRETHSIFFKSLQEKGFILTFKLADDANLLLSKYGEYLYKNLIIFAPGVDEFGGDISVEKLADFVDNGGNVLVAGSEYSGDAIREFASECGFEVDEEGASVIDHLHYDNSDLGDHTKVLTRSSNLLNAPIIVGGGETNPIIYKGSGLLADKENPLVLQLLTAESSAYSYNPETHINEYPHAIGRGTLLIAALQARNNARVVFSGSLYFFSDEAFEMPVQYAQNKRLHSNSGNFALSTAINKWVFGESGRLRVQYVNHHRESESKPPQSYTITDNVVYEISIEQLENDVWKPFKAIDVQLEFVRIDPFIRITLQQLTGSFYEAKLKIPDVYGVYQFKINYDRVGFTNLYNTTHVSIRPLEHTQYERFIPSAYPYYSSEFSMMIGVFLFTFVFLHFREENINLKVNEKKLR